jgi:response regulator RpfG family c-di-GMP phosphodiesterase
VKRNFVVVAANAQVRESLAGELRALGYTVTRATNGSAAEKIVGSVAVDAVILESHLPDRRPEELRERLIELRPECRVVVVTSFDQVRNTPEQLRFGADDYLLRADQILELLQAPFQAAREGSTASTAKRERAALLQVIDVLVSLLELDDRHFGGFSHHAMRLARAVAEELAVDEETVTEVALAALLRDVGKVDVEPDLLNESGWYSEEQRERMKTHVAASLKLFEHVDFPWKILPIIRHHHERYDGAGYPDGLRGRDIPIGARIVSVVDAFVAVTSGRVHRGAFDPEQALTLIAGEAGKQFDPEVVEALQKVLDKRRTAGARGERPAVMLANVRDEFRKVIKMGLVNEGCEVREPDGLAAASRELLKDRPELVLADVDVDREEVFRFLHEVRENPLTCRQPVAFLARRPDRLLKLRALRDGVDDFLVKSDDLTEVVARVHNILTREAARRDGRATVHRRGITGDLENLCLTDIVQTLVVGLKTARVTLTSGKRQGQIWFENGAARHAEIGELKGEPAFYDLIGWSAGEFVIEHGVRTREHTLHRDAMFLVMEGLRLLDEASTDQPSRL